MKLRFIGADGSMGLRRHHVYDVDIRSTKYGFIMAEWYDGGLVRCPYTSPQAVAANWESVGEVRKWER